MTANKAVTPILAAILANILWGSTFMASKVILAQCPPITAITIRFAVALLAFLLIAILKKHDFQPSVFKKRFPDFFLLGIVGYTGLYFFQMVALTKITSVQSSAIMLLAPIFTLILNLVQTKTVDLRNVTVVVLSFIGAALIFLDHNKLDYTNVELSGLLYTLMASFFFGWSVPITKKLLTPKNDEPQLSIFNLTFYSILIGTCFLFVIALWEIENPATPLNLNFKFWGWIVYLGIACSSIAFFLWNWSIKKISPIAVAASMYLKTPVALLIGAIVLSERLSFVFYLGTAIILATLFLNQVLNGNGVKK